MTDKTMHDTRIETELAAVQAHRDGRPDDPRALHDEVQGLISQLEAAAEEVPASLRVAAEDLEAEVVEEFYDNLPV